MNACAPSGCEHEPTRADLVFRAVVIEQDLAFEDVQCLVDIGVEVHRCHLALFELVLKDQERVPGFGGICLPRVSAATGEPSAIAISLVAHDRCCHC